jgi:hypothetical protein
MAFLVPTLVVLRNELNVKFPHRTKEKDGWIGDAAHQEEGSASDHNPNARGAVRAIDVDVRGIAPKALVRACIHHSTCQYVIFDRTIWSRPFGFEARRYTGKNPHTDHVHVSCRHGRDFEDDRSGWKITAQAADALVRADPDHRPGSRTLRLIEPHMQGADVGFIQRFIGKSKAGDDDGFFGTKTEEGVRFYQKLRGIAVTGVCDKNTFHEMGV